MNSEISLIVNAINNEIAKRFNPDTQMMQAISLLNMNIANFLNNELRKLNIGYIIEYLYGYYNYFIFSILCYFIYRYKNNIKDLYNTYLIYEKNEEIDINQSINKDDPKIKTKEIEPERVLYKIDISNISTSIIMMNKYIQLHPEFYDTNISQKMVNFHDDIYTPVYLDRLKFNDTNLDVHGYIETEYSETIINKEFTKKKYKMIISLYKKKIDKSSYIDNIEKHVNKQIKYGNQVSLNYYKVLNTNLVCYNFYNEDLQKWKDDIKFIENGFFSPHKEYIFSIMKQKMEYSIENNHWNNLLLHGIAGSGKSSLIYRIATLLKKSIVSIDLNLYIDKKKELYALFHGQEFSLPSVDVKQTINKNCIIILEEFDNCVKKLVDLEQMHEFKSLAIKQSFDEKKNQAFEDSIQLKKKLKNKDFNTDSHESITKNTRSNRDFSNTLSMVNLDIDTAIKSINESNKSDILRLSDLLELFQGPIPIKDRLIIATTNYFDEIKNTIPALFRAGRLTPIHFSYLDWKSFNDLCFYYFKKNMDCDPFELNIPSSQLIEIAVKYSIVKKDFNSFKKEVIKLNNTKRFNTNTHWAKNLNKENSIINNDSSIINNDNINDDNELESNIDIENDVIIKNKELTNIVERIRNNIGNDIYNFYCKNYKKKEAIEQFDLINNLNIDTEEINTTDILTEYIFDKSDNDNDEEQEGKQKMFVIDKTRFCPKALHIDDITDEQYYKYLLEQDSTEKKMINIFDEDRPIDVTTELKEEQSSNQITRMEINERSDEYINTKLEKTTDERTQNSLKISYNIMEKSNNVEQIQSNNTTMLLESNTNTIKLTNI